MVDDPYAKINSLNKRTSTALNSPDDPYKHGAYLIELQKGKGEKEVAEVGNMGEIVNKDIQLGNLSDIKDLGLGQAETTILVAMFDYARRELSLRTVYHIMFNTFKARILLTKASGKIRERDYQAMIGSSWTPEGDKQQMQQVPRPDLQDNQQQQKGMF